MSYNLSDLDEEENNFDNSLHGICPLCEGNLYEKTIFHICASVEDDDIQARLDIYICKECELLHARVNGEKRYLPHEMQCDCD